MLENEASHRQSKCENRRYWRSRDAGSGFPGQERKTEAITIN
jgi:hypothetical protein